MTNGWVALLRGINLAKRNRIAMPELRGLFEELGHDSVRTYIASGNVLFTSRSRSRAALARKLEQAVAERFGVDAAVVLRTFDELAAVVDAHPFGKDTANTYVSFLTEKPEAKAVRRLAELEVAPDRAEVAGTEVYLQYPNGLAEANLTGTLLGKTLGVPGTVRNWRTVSKLAELART